MIALTRISFDGNMHSDIVFINWEFRRNLFQKFEIFINAIFVISIYSLYLFFQFYDNNSLSHLNDIQFNKNNNFLTNSLSNKSYDDTHLHYFNIINGLYNPNTNISKNNYDNKNKKYNISTNFSSTNRKLIEISDLNKLIQKKHIFSRLLKKVYRGTWYSNNGFKVGNKNSGEIIVKFNLSYFRNIFFPELSMYLTLYEQNYIDNWKFSKAIMKQNDIGYFKDDNISNNEILDIFKKNNNSDNPNNNNTNILTTNAYHNLSYNVNSNKFNNNTHNNNTSLNIHDNKGKINIFGIFNGISGNGKYLSIVENSVKNNCLEKINMIFETEDIIVPIRFINGTVIKPLIKTINDNTFNMTVSSSCGINITATFIDQHKLEEILKNEKKDKIASVNRYTILILITSISYFISVWKTTTQFKNNTQCVKAIFWFNICINFNWDIYISITHIYFLIATFFSLNCPENFAIISFIYILIFILCDLRFLYYFFKSRQNENIFNNTKTKIYFYVCFYFIFFSSLTYIGKLIINEIDIMLIIGLMWIPQLIYNEIFDNNYIYPFTYIVSTSLNKIIFICYFKGINNNFMRIKPNLLYITILITFTIFLIILLYLQNLKEIRIFKSKNYNTKKIYDFYKTLKELIDFDENLINEECAICLTKIFIDNGNILENKNTNEIKDIKIYNNCNINNNDYTYNIHIYNDNKNNSYYDKNDNQKNDINENDINLDIKDNSNEIIEMKDIQDKCYNELSYKGKNDDEIIRINKRLKNDMYNQKNSYLKLSGLQSFSCIYNIKQIIYMILVKNLFKFHKRSMNFYNKQYMLTPCYHVFHTQCLETWFENKKECPNCRKKFNDIF